MIARKMLMEKSRKWRVCRPGRRGMTLVELMISLLIFGIIMGVLFGFLTGARDSYDSTRRKAQYQQAVRASLSLISREIRSIGCDPNPLSPGFERIVRADANVLQCRMDLNGDLDQTDTTPDEDVTYTFNAGTGELSRNNTVDNMVILRDLQNVTFSYFDAAGNPLNSLPLNAVDRSNVRTVAISFQGETVDHSPVNYATQVSLRNE